MATASKKTAPKKPAPASAAKPSATPRISQAEIDAQDAAQSVADAHALLKSLTPSEAQSVGIYNGMAFEEQVRRALTIAR